MTPMLSTDEVATFLGVQAKTVRSLITAGELRGYRIGRVIKVRPADLDNYLETHQVTG